ncbi:MAG: glycosyltransferase [Gammaproteobacteria bacterium]|nr:glycosyltransferase [Gammaproteobacteria bacterium]MDH3468150.1 glycosyltransferase [Gammaproteobacteria bacterium]
MNSSNVRVLHVCRSESRDGAGIGAYRLHSAMVKEGIDSRMLVIKKRSMDPNVIELERPSRGVLLAWRVLSRRLLRLQRSSNRVFHSLNIFPTGTHRVINRLGGDIVQFHWVGASMISISEIAKVRIPIVWKMPDMWAFSGAEHYMLPGDPERYQEGYTRRNRPAADAGVDINRLVWAYKRRCWKDSQFTITCPSKWMAKCASESKLFCDYEVINIPNPIDLEKYRPVPKNEARRVFGLSNDKRLILFGAVNATKDRRKGYQYLPATLRALSESFGPDQCELVVFGSEGDDNTFLHGYKVNFLGNLSDENALVSAYGSADVVVFPAEMDNLPNVIKEATACGTPCVAFDVGGLPDMIRHRDSGFLAAPYKPLELAKGVRWVFSQPADALSRRVRRYAEELHNQSGRVADYLDLYREVLQATKGKGSNTGCGG